jgi:hypothetical protein
MMTSDPEAEVNVGGPAREEDPEVAREEERKVYVLDGAESFVLDESMRLETVIDIAVSCAGLVSKSAAACRRRERTRH